MQINDLSYIKACKAIAQLRVIADEAVGTFFEDDLRKTANAIVAQLCERYKTSFAAARSVKPAVFAINDDADYARRHWVENDRQRFS